ncbi:MAG TPA: phosphatidate cytidylyltransferase [Bryobacteraceae bacterium]|nr:phosphatidate cytidylyltransferase [Bryobacteraceae bacterium]
MKRALTALILVPVAIYSVIFAPSQIFLAVDALFAIFCFREYARITNAWAMPGYVAGLLILIAPLNQAALILFLTALAALCLTMSAADFGKGAAQASALVMGVAYIFGSWKTAILLHEIDGPAYHGIAAGRYWLMFSLVVNWIGDTGAYYVGRSFGRHKLAPRVSPGKSWEGAAASTVAGIVFGAIFLPLTIADMPVWIAALIALVANAAGQIGDLAESALKRGAGVKDSGTMLPGHGGMLDRLDSSLFAMPVVYTLVMAIAEARR